MPIPQPRLPGVPPLLNEAANAAAVGALVAADVALVRSLLDRPTWGIFKNGVIVVQADTCVNFEFKNEWNIAEYPLELGAFESYNKVATPYDARVRMARGGTLQERSAFLSALERAAASMELYDVVTPEKVYINANIKSYDYRRDRQNAGMIVAEIRLIEIRVTTAPVFTTATTVQPRGATAVDNGTVQAQAASPAIVQAAQAGP